VSSVELRQLYAQSDVFVSPVSSGTGASTKILEAMSHAKPVMATSVSVRGYELVAGRDYLLCAGDGEFADVLRDLSEDPSLAANLSEAGRRFAAAHQPESAYSPYLRLVRELADRP
jgi:glycosyltransferase involved in cell wall biosynthesis